MTWLPTADVAARIHRARTTVVRAAEEGRLHGHQAVACGKWTFAAAAVDVYVQGGDEWAQREACGCARLRSVRRAS